MSLKIKLKDIDILTLPACLPSSHLANFLAYLCPALCVYRGPEAPARSLCSPSVVSSVDMEGCLLRAWTMDGARGCCLCVVPVPVPVPVPVLLLLPLSGVLELEPELELVGLLLLPLLACREEEEVVALDGG